MVSLRFVKTKHSLTFYVLQISQFLIIVTNLLVVHVKVCGREHE
jgi:hypothetical protein